MGFCGFTEFAPPAWQDAQFCSKIACPLGQAFLDADFFENAGAATITVAAAIQMPTTVAREFSMHIPPLKLYRVFVLVYYLNRVHLSSGSRRIYSFFNADQVLPACLLRAKVMQKRTQVT
jgi:hypothetical protein